MKSRIGAELLRHFSILDKEIDISLIHKNMAQRHRIAGDILASDVEKPHNSVELTVDVD